jgi:DeoR/GlpR family transcriptional regulator of sugar metabolism
MTPTELMRQEILRLTRATRHSAFISTRRLSAFYNVPEKTVRCELAKLADENRIRLTGGQSNEEFIEKSPEGVAVRVDLVESRASDL